MACRQWCRVTVTAGTLTSITLNGSPVAFTRQTIKGVEYAFHSGSHSSGLTSGLKPGDVRSSNNFAFGISYTGAGSNPTGNFNTLVRSTANSVVSTYQIKGSTITSLVVTGNKATIKGTASINDVTSGTVLVDGSATFEVSITDNGEPGSADTIAITIRNSAGALWFSSNWDSVNAKSLEQLLGGGNLKLP